MIIGILRVLTLSMGKWEYGAGPGYLLTLLLLLSMDGKGEQGEIWVQEVSDELLSPL